jgi:hypothetical protein
MTAPQVFRAADVIARAMRNHSSNPMLLAEALESAQLLQSPETAAELARLRAALANEHDELALALGRSNGTEWGDLIEYAAGAASAEVKLRARVAELEHGPALPWAHEMSDDDLHGFLGDLVSAAMGRWQSQPEVPDREVLAAVEKACAEWRTPGEGYRSDEAERARTLHEHIIARDAEIERLRARLAEYERPADEDPIRYALTEQAAFVGCDSCGTPDLCAPAGSCARLKQPRDAAEDVTPQVAKLRALLAGQREQAADMPYRAVRGSIEIGSYATEGAAREACETVARQIWPNGEPRWISAADEPEEMHAGSVAEMDISIDRRVRQTCIAVKRAAETGGA